MLTRSPMRRVGRNTGPSQYVRLALCERSGGWCEMRLSGCTGKATEAAHRIGRKAGGRHGEALTESNRLSNLIHSCATCHRWTHDNPALAQDLGLMLREYQDPSLEPVAYQNAGWVVLDDEAGLWPVAA